MNSVNDWPSGTGQITTMLKAIIVEKELQLRKAFNFFKYALNKSLV